MLIHFDVSCDAYAVAHVASAPAWPPMLPIVNAPWKMVTLVSEGGNDGERDGEREGLGVVGPVGILVGDLDGARDGDLDGGLVGLADVGAREEGACVEVNVPMQAQNR